jgi:hypothetical protein
MVAVVAGVGPEPMRLSHMRGQLERGELRLAGFVIDLVASLTPSFELGLAAIWSTSN